MNLDTNDEVFKVIKMLHSTNRQEDCKKKSIIDWTGKNETSLVWQKFYAIADLEKDEFIHPDGSLRFEYGIKKKNF